MGSSRNRNPLIIDAFQASQDSFSVHPKLVKKLKDYYTTTDPDRFFEDFIFFMKIPISGVTERSPFIDRTLEFIAKFSCSFLEEEPKDAGKEGEEEEELPLFLYRVFSWLLDHHEVEGADARLRVCQLLNKILKYMGEEACIDDDLYNKIYDGMLERLKDKVAEIRAQAVTALQRLQDPKDEECPIIKAYLFHLSHDPNNIVRRTIVRCIGATRLTLPHILERTRDVDEHVRRAAYKFLAEKVHIKSLTISQREGVLKRGLGDRSEVVRKVVEKEMIPSWLRLSNNNIVQLLHHLDVGNSDQDSKPGNKSAPAGALHTMFQDTPLKELINSFQYLDVDKLIPLEKLTPETAMYWRVLAEYLEEQTSPGAEEYLEMIMPELSAFCQYVRKYVMELPTDDENGNWEFVARELIKMTLLYDLGDEVGRKNLRKLIKDILISNKSPVNFVPSLVEVFNKVEKNPQSRVDQIAEIISELKDPLEADEVPGSPDIFHSAPETPVASPIIDNSNEELIRAKQLAIANVRVTVNMMKDQLDEAVKKQDFMRAQEIKTQLDGLEEEQIILESQLAAARAAAAGPVPASAPAVSAAADQLDAETSSEASLDNPAVTLKCLRLLVASLQDPSITQLNSTLLTLLEEFITISVQSEIAAIRKEAILALSCCCLRSLESARQHMLLLLQAAHIDLHEVRIAAITAVVDLLMKHGLTSFITAEENSNDVSNDNSSSVSPSKCGDSSIDNAMESDLATRGATLTQTELNTQGGNSVVAILTKILEEPDLELRTEVAEGLCKLLMIGSISSPKLLSRLLLIWYNPMTESDSKLRHILGTFFPLYCSMTKQNQTAMEDAFVPTIKILFDAPVTSPLAEIDIEDVGMFFVHLTREDMLQSYDKDKATSTQESTSTSVHDSLAVSVCNQILSAPDGYQTKVLIKILTNLALTSNHYVHLKSLKVMSETLIKSVKERSCVRSLEKFDKQLNDWIAKDPSNVPENIDKPKSSCEDSGEDSPNKEADGSLTPSRGRKRILFSQTVSNTLLDMDSTPAKNARMFTTPRKVERSNTVDTNDSEAITEKGSETEKEVSSSEVTDAEQEDRITYDGNKEPLFANILAVSSEEDTDDDVFSQSDVDTSKLPRVTTVDNSTTDSESEKLNNSKDKSSPTPKKSGRKSKKKTKTIPSIPATPQTVSRAGRNNSPRIDYKTGRILGDSARKDSAKPVSASTERKERGREKVASVSKPTKSRTGLLSSRREERKRASEKGSETNLSDTTSSPTPKRNLKDSVDSVKPRSSQRGSTAEPPRQTRATRSTRK